MIVVPDFRTVPGMNVREPWQARARRVKRERQIVGWTLVSKAKPTLPCSVLLTRVAPSSGLDTDNLAGALKGVRDEIAAWLEVDDRDETRVRYCYAQVRGPWSVRIEFGPPASGAQFEMLGISRMPWVWGQL